MDVQDWMSREVETVGSNDTLEVADDKMKQRGCRRLPVVDDNGLLVGIVTDRDLREHKGYLSSTRINAAMTEEPHTVKPDEPIEQAAEVMLRNEIGGLPVVQPPSQLVGIITMTDLVRGLVRTLNGGEDFSGRIDLDLRPEQSVYEAARAAEAAGGTVLGVGSAHARSGEQPRRRFYLRIKGDEVARIASELERQGFVVRVVQPATDSADRAAGGGVS